MAKRTKVTKTFWDGEGKRQSFYVRNKEQYYDNLKKGLDEFMAKEKQRKNQWKISVLDFISTYGWAIAIVLISVIILLFQN